MCIAQLCFDVPVSSEPCICSGYTLLYTYTALWLAWSKRFPKSLLVSASGLPQSSFLFSEDCMQSQHGLPSGRASTPDLQDLKSICGYIVNSVFNFLIDIGLCWSLFSLLRPKQKEERVCFHSQFKGAVAMGVGRSMAAGRRGEENWCPLHLPFLFRSRWHPHSEWILSPHPDLDNPTQGGPSLCLIHQDPVKPTTNINQF